MKSLQQGLANLQVGGERPQPQISDKAKEFIDRLFEELKAAKPAWRQAWPDQKAEDMAKRSWVKAFNENGISSVAQVKAGLVTLRADSRPFLPSVGEFIDWCNAIDSDDAFWRMINQEPCHNQAEKVTRERVGYKCRTQLSEEKARKVFDKEYAENVKRERRGDLGQHDLKALPPKSVVTEVDKMVSDRVSRGPLTDIERRMMAMRKK